MRVVVARDAATGGPRWGLSVWLMVTSLEEERACTQRVCVSLWQAEQNPRTAKLSMEKYENGY